MLEMNKVYLMNCMEGMRDIPDKYFELAIVDPPYGIGNFVHQGGKHAREDAKQHNVKWNDRTPTDKYFGELLRVSQRRIVWGANYYNCFSDGGGAVVWYKNMGEGNVSQCEIASLSFQKKVDYVHINWSAGFYRARIESIIHECQKPVSLYKWLLHNYAKPGDKILDTHVGSGSSIIACIDKGFEYMGFEIDEDYYRDMQDRIYQFTRQTTLEGI
jgi:site-specific DNA-methyltransferase (adenine-specific)